MIHRPTFCCIPVSGPTGLGELMRLLTLASAAQQEWPQARVHFVLNRALPARARALIPDAFDVTWLTTSPTWDDWGVMAALDACRPDLVLFDNAGTWRQCRHARRRGARTIFLSTRAQTRARGLHPRWLPWLDEHWRVGPTALEGALSPWQQIKVALCRTTVRSLQSLFTSSPADRRAATRRDAGCAARPYVCFVPGGGGGTVEGLSAVSLFADAAALVARQSGVTCLLLEGPLHQGIAPARSGVIIQRATHAQAVDLMEDADLVVVGASSSLFQALAQRRVCVATSTGGNEQPERARAWAARGVVAAAEPRAESLAGVVGELLADPARCEAVRRRVAALGVTNDLPQAVSALRRLLIGSAPGMG